MQGYRDDAGSHVLQLLMTWKRYADRLKIEAFCLGYAIANA